MKKTILFILVSLPESHEKPPKGIVSIEIEMHEIVG
jgi:hypothetical protein